MNRGSRLSIAPPRGACRSDDSRARVRADEPYRTRPSSTAAQLDDQVPADQSLHSKEPLGYSWRLLTHSSLHPSATQRERPLEQWHRSIRLALSPHRAQAPLPTHPPLRHVGAFERCVGVREPGRRRRAMPSVARARGAPPHPSRGVLLGLLHRNLRSRRRGSALHLHGNLSRRSSWIPSRRLRHVHPGSPCVRDPSG